MKVDTSPAQSSGPRSVVSEIENWILMTQYSAAGIFEPTGYDQSATLYQTPVESSFVLSMINGTSKAATFSDGSKESQFEQLISAVRSVTEDEESYWFYGVDPFDEVSVLEWVRENDYEQCSQSNLGSFETSPAQEGGKAWLGLVGASKKWMLLIGYDPGAGFQITVHGTLKFCTMMTQWLKVTPEPGEENP